MAGLPLLEVAILPPLKGTNFFFFFSASAKPYHSVTFVFFKELFLGFLSCSLEEAEPSRKRLRSSATSVEFAEHLTQILTFNASFVKCLYKNCTSSASNPTEVFKLIRKKRPGAHKFLCTLHSKQNQSEILDEIEIDYSC